MHYVFLHEYHEKYPKIHCRVMISSKYSHALYCTVTESLIFFLHLLPFRLFPSCNIYDSYFFIVSFIHLNFSSFLMTKRIYFFFLIHNKKMTFSQKHVQITVSWRHTKGDCCSWANIIKAAYSQPFIKPAAKESWEKQ